MKFNVLILTVSILLSSWIVLSSANAQSSTKVCTLTARLSSEFYNDLKNNFCENFPGLCGELVAIAKEEFGKPINKRTVRSGILNGCNYTIGKDGILKVGGDKNLVKQLMDELIDNAYFTKVKLLKK